jgi:hypothetical protein
VKWVVHSGCFITRRLLNFRLVVEEEDEKSDSQWDKKQYNTRAFVLCTSASTPIRYLIACIVVYWKMFLFPSSYFKMYSNEINLTKLNKTERYAWFCCLHFRLLLLLCFHIPAVLFCSWSCHIYLPSRASALPVLNLFWRKQRCFLNVLKWTNTTTNYRPRIKPQVFLQRQFLNNNHQAIPVGISTARL